MVLRMRDKIIIADDHPLFREAISRLIRRSFPGKIVEVADADALNEQVRKLPTPTLLILDLIFPGFDGERSVARLRQECPQTVIVVISMNDDPSTAARILEAGANGFISKSVPPEEIVQAIDKVFQGDLVTLLEAQPISELVQSSPIEGLSPRHIELLVRLGQGKSNKEIARDLGISPFTVRAHMSVLFRKLGVSSRSAAAAIAAQNGLV